MKSTSSRARQLYNLVIVNHLGRGDGLAEAVARTGMNCSIEDEATFLRDEEGFDSPDAVLVDLASVGPTAAKQVVEHCKGRKLPVVAALPREVIAQYDASLNPDELLICPVSDDELSLRVQQAVFRVKGPSGSQTLAVGDLTIDLERYEVSSAGRRVTLTYKEFQLLALLASNPGRVYTREALLSQVWGYDYLGGTRTVDVHVRRLRSKVESPGRSFIETIWNVGYRFKAPG